MSELAFKSLAEIANLIKSRQISPVELTDDMLARISSLNATFLAYATVTPDLARQQAQAAEDEIAAGTYRGPLHGVPIGLKDLLDTKGIKTACGSTIMQDNIPTEDATVVSRLADAGAVTLGKLNMTEGALAGYHPDMPVPVNPWGHDRWSGVSSSGSAVAMAAGMAFGTLGTDTGGSIRYPSAANGVVGLKPTFGLVSKHGAFPLAHTLDHIGPITRRVEDAALMLQVLAGHDPKDPFSLRSAPVDYAASLDGDVRGMRIGVDEAFLTLNTHPEVSGAVLAAVEVLKGEGAEIVAVDILAITAMAGLWGVTVAAEAAIAHAETHPSRADDYGPVLGGALAAAPHITAADYAGVRIAAAGAKAALDAALAGVDVIACQSAPAPSPTIEEFPPTAILPDEVVAAFLGCTAPFNYTGHPTLSLPCGFSSENLPVSLQLVGRHEGEAAIIRVGHAYEQATDWHTRHPAID